VFATLMFGVDLGVLAYKGEKVCYWKPFSCLLFIELQQTTDFSASRPKPCPVCTVLLHVWLPWHPRRPWGGC